MMSKVLQSRRFRRLSAAAAVLAAVVALGLCHSADPPASPDDPRAARDGSSHGERRLGAKLGSGIASRTVDSARRTRYVSSAALHDLRAYEEAPRDDLHAKLKTEPRWLNMLVALDGTPEFYDACHQHLEPDEICELSETLVVERTAEGVGHVAMVEFESNSGERCVRYASCQAEAMIGREAPLPEGTPDIVAYRREDMKFGNYLPGMMADPAVLAREIESMERSVAILAEGMPDMSPAELEYSRDGAEMILEYYKEKQAELSRTSGAAP